MSPELEVIWPLHNRHYLNLDTYPLTAARPDREPTGRRAIGRRLRLGPDWRDAERGPTVHSRPEVDDTASVLHDDETLEENIEADTPAAAGEARADEGQAARGADRLTDDGRRLAAHALVTGAHGTRGRVGTLLGVSARTIGRLIAAIPPAARQDATVLEAARACLTASSRRGSTAHERDAALAWLLTDGAVPSDDRPAASPEHRPPRATPDPPPPPRPRSRTGRGSRRSRRRTDGRGSRPAITADRPPSSGPRRDRPTLPREQLDELQRQHGRILMRTMVMDCVLQAEARIRDGHAAASDPRPRAAALAELLEDIATAAGAIGRILQQVDADH